MGLPLPFGRYVLEERIAVGGMAEIFRARIDSEGFAKRVCIKRITPTLADQSHFISMFRDEASFAARMQHANIVQVFDFGEHEGTLYLAMEYVDGSDLRKLLERARHRSLRVRLGHALQIAIEVCRGLHYAHQLTDDRGRPLGIIHRDISPHNILVSRAGEVKVTDFGIAKASERSTHTATGVLKGKLAYCAPEQAAGETLDQRVDQFALGIVLWEALTGKRLFTGEHDASILRKVMFCEVPRPSLHRSDLPPSIEAVVMKALAGRPEDRFPDLRHMEHALGRCLYEVTQDPEDTQLAPLVLSLLGEPDSARRQTAVLEGASGIAPPKEPTLSHGHISAVFTSLKPPGPAEIVDDTILALSSAIDDDERAAPDSRTTLDRLPRQHPPRAETAVTQTLAPPLSPGIIDVRTSLPAPVASRRKVATLALLVMGTVAATMLWLAERPDQRELSSHNASSPNIAVSGAGAPSSSEAIQDAGIAEVADKATSSTKVPQNASLDLRSAVESVTKPPATDEPPAPPVLARRRPPSRSMVRRDTPQKTQSSPVPDAAAPPAGRILIELDRGWAHAYAGAQRLCETPCTLELPAGPHELRFVTGDGKVFMQRVIVKAGEVVRLVVPTS